MSIKLPGIFVSNAELASSPKKLKRGYLSKLGNKSFLSTKLTESKELLRELLVKQYAWFIKTACGQIGCTAGG